MRKTIAMLAVLAIGLLAGTLAPPSGAHAAAQPSSQDDSTGPYNPGLPRD